MGIDGWMDGGKAEKRDSSSVQPLQLSFFGKATHTRLIIAPAGPERAPSREVVRCLCWHR